jgi:hypothetical protein
MTDRLRLAAQSLVDRLDQLFLGAITQECVNELKTALAEPAEPKPRVHPGPPSSHGPNCQDGYCECRQPAEPSREREGCCQRCGHRAGEHADESRIVGCMHGDGTNDAPFCGCRNLRGECGGTGRGVP